MAQFSFRICKETLMESQTVSSIGFLNFITTAIVWIFLSLLKKTSRINITPIVPFQARLIAALIETLHFIFYTKSVSLNTYSFHRFALLFSIPYCIFVSYFFLGKRVSPFSVGSIALFLAGSSIISRDSFNVTSTSFHFGILYAVFNAHLAIYIEEVVIDSGVSAIIFQQSIISFRLIFSAIFLLFEVILYFGSSIIYIHITLFSLGMLLVTAALELISIIAMIKFISFSSAISFLVSQQMCEIFLIFIGHTFHPTHFTTLNEAISTFFGVVLAVIGQLLFIVGGESFEWIPAEMPTIRNSTDNSRLGDTDSLVQ